jgi:hypothetical protein
MLWPSFHTSSLQTSLLVYAKFDRKRFFTDYYATSGVDSAAPDEAIRNAFPDMHDGLPATFDPGEVA